MERWDLFTAPLDGPTLIEASAGTGKTYTITGLYLRLVAEKDLPVAAILVMTFTNAATAELRERILARLISCRDALESGGDDELAQRLVSACGDVETPRLRLQRAILEFDQAAVYTIHGFCQRVLADSAFRGALPFEVERVVAQPERLQRVVDDYWAMHLQHGASPFVDWLLEQKISADSLYQDLSTWLGRPGLEVLAVPMPVPEVVEMAESAVDAAFEVAAGTWRREREAIVALLKDNVTLKGNIYRKGLFDGWFAGMDAYLGGGGACPPKFEKFTHREIEAATKKGCTPLQHPFFHACQELFDARERLHGLYRQAYFAHRAALMAFARERLEEEKARERARTFDDLIGDLHGALHAEHGDCLAALLRGRYRAALVDEFQDTDPLQYGILSRIYAGQPHPLFLVGDPKQAIYSFRGADVYAYLRARGDTRRQYTLAENWRSVPALVGAVNRLFEGHERPFLDPRIGFHPVVAAQEGKADLTVKGDDPSVFRFRFLTMEEEMRNAEGRSRCVAMDTAAEIARLLRAAEQEEACIGDAPLEAKDIAVLVRTRVQGQQVLEALRAVGINAVLRTHDSVFQTDEAVALERLLLALLEPGRGGLVRAALVTPLFGYSGDRLGALDGDEEGLDEAMDRILDYHRLWRAQGFARMFRRLMLKEGVAERLLGRQGGERRMTNFNHLAELLHAEERERQPGMEGLVKWLSAQRSLNHPSDDPSVLRLESDAALVQIVTIHASKGLQYPVVFCPYLWYASSGRWGAATSGTPFLFHRAGEDERLVLEVGSAQMEAHWQQALAESLAEEIRLLYVAVTRAQCRCYCTWVPFDGSGYTGLGWLLRPPASIAEGMQIDERKAAFKGMDGEAHHALLEALARRCDAISVTRIDQIRPEVPLDLEGGVMQQLQALRFQGVIPPPQRLTSFSALASRLHVQDDADHDALPDEAAPLPEIPEGYSVDSFPRGARAGSCLHRIFERLDFTDATPEVLSSVVGEALARYGFGADWAPFVSRWTARVLDTPLDGEGLRLAQVGLGRRLTELEFHYPLKQLDSSGLRDLLVEHGFAPEGPVREALRRLDFQPVRGFMHGFIDLVFEAGGRFHLLDYKSNWLGLGRTPYAAERLGETIARDSYYLQYLFYALAVHRYLRGRIPGYRYETHFGGIYYLFLRGMDPEWGSDYGIYRARIPGAVITALDRYLEEGRG